MTSPESLPTQDPRQTAFHYDRAVFAQCVAYVRARNYHGLALIARQKGIPPFLRFKAWPLLLKHHPFVANPFLQPDVDKDKAGEDDEDAQSTLQSKVRKDLRRYIHRVAYSSAEEPLLKTELELFDTVERAILKFVAKWGRIVKYDQALTWMALGLAEWLPPIPHTPWVLLGREVSLSAHTCIGLVFEDYELYIDADPAVRPMLDAMLADDAHSLSFAEVYERLALVLLHSPEAANKRVGKLLKIDKSTLPISGGTLEERVSFFIYVLQKLLPELAQLFQDEQILNKFGSHDDEWLIWWLKYCGSKVWSRVDRGRVWDLMTGWRLQSRKAEHNLAYYSDKLSMSADVLAKLGPDSFWTVGYEEDDKGRLLKDDSFSDLINDLHITPHYNDSSSSLSGNTLPLLTPSLGATSSASTPDDNKSYPFSKIDPHIELLFVSLALLKAKENTLVELDQHEIRTFLSRLPAKSFKLSDKYKQYQEQKDKEKGAVPGDHGFTYDYMDSIIYEAGELWRKWLWMDMSESS